jgi:hypothetical protein
MYACKSLKIQGNLCIEFYAQKCEQIAYAEGAFLLGFPISSQNRDSMRVS